MDLEIAPELYPLMEGTTDSERLFFLALTLGLADDPPRALHCMVERVEALAKAHHVPAPLIMTLALSDGERIFAVRYSSQGNDSPTLYHTRNVHAIREVDGQSERLPDDAVIVLSEPIDDVSAHWENIPERTLLEIENGAITQLPFHPA